MVGTNCEKNDFEPHRSVRKMCLLNENLNLRENEKINF